MRQENDFWEAISLWGETILALYYFNQWSLKDLVYFFVLIFYLWQVIFQFAIYLTLSTDWFQVCVSYLNTCYAAQTQAQKLSLAIQASCVLSTGCLKSPWQNPTELARPKMAGKEAKGHPFFIVCWLYHQASISPHGCNDLIVQGIQEQKGVDLIPRILCLFLKNEMSDSTLILPLGLFTVKVSLISAWGEDAFRAWAPLFHSLPQTQFPY